MPSLRWAIAAMALIGVSFLFGYLSVPRPPSTDHLVAEVRRELESYLIKAKKELVQSAMKNHSQSINEVRAIRDDIETLMFHQTQ
jgi:hypothetical protein